ETIATTSSSIRTPGAVSFTAEGAALAATAAVASASGGNGTDSNGNSTDKDGSVDDKVQKQSGDSNQRMSDAKIGDADQQSTVGAEGSSANGKASTSEGGVAVAAAIAVDVSTVKVKAYVPASVGVKAGQALSVHSVANVDAKTSADGSTTAASGNGSTPTKVGVGAAVAVNVVTADDRAELGTAAAATAAGQISGVTAGHYDGAAVQLTALKTDLGVASPTAVGAADLPHAPSATTALGRVDQIVAYAKSGSSGAKVGIAGSVAVNVVTSKSVADIDSAATVHVVPLAPSDGGVVLRSDNEAYVAGSALAATDGASGAKVGVGASVALNTVQNTSEASLAQNAALTGANSLAITADSHLDTDAMAQAGASGGTALDAVVAFTILSEKTTASMESGGLVSVGGDVTVRATSVGAHSAIASGSAASSGSGGTAIGGSVALITGTGLFDAISGAGGPITTDTEARIARNVSSTRDLSVSASGAHTYAASSTATAGGGSAEDKGAAGGSKSVSSKTLGSAPASDAMNQEQSGLSANGGGSSGGKLSVAAALGAAIIGDTAKASIADSLTLSATRNVTISAASADQVQTLGSAAAASSNQDNGIGIGAALTVVDNATKASIGDSVHVISGGAITVQATSTVNKDLGGLTAEAMSGASGKKLSVAGSLAIGISTSITNATIGNNFSVDLPGDALNRAGAISVVADNTTSLAAKAWSGSYSSQGNGIGASIAAAISNDSYTASIGNSATINAASVNVQAINERVDDIYATIRTLAQPVTTTLSDINSELTANANNAKSLVSDVDSASGASDAVSSFKAGFADQITSDKKKILDSLKTTAALARDLPLLGSNNFYTEVVAGAASGSKLAISGGLALQIMLEHTTASIGTGANINSTGAVTLDAHDNAVSRTLVGALSASGGSSAAGISLGIIVNSGSVDAHIGSNALVSRSSSIGVNAGAQHEIDLFEISAAAADANGIAGILGVVYSQASVSAQTGTGSSLTSSGAVSVAATNSISALNLAGGIAVGGNNGIGGVAISTTVNNSATATIDSSAVSATTVDAASVSVSAQTAEKLINVGVAGAGAGSNAIAGVATPLVQLLDTEATIGASATIRASAGDVSVTAADNTLLVNVGGVIALGGNNGVGGAAAVGVLTDTIRAGIGDDATVDATGAVIVTAGAKETVSDDVVSGSGGGNVGVAVAIASSVITDQTSATIGQRAKVGTILRPSGVRVAADDTSLIVDLAGTIGAGGGTGVGAGVDANVLTKTTTATIGGNAVVKSGGDVVVQATSAETVFSLVAGLAAGGDAGVAGSVGAFVLTGNTIATIAGGADVRADGNVGVIANDADELDRLVGSGAVGGTAGVGGAIGVSVALQNTKAVVADGASVEGLGLGGTLGVTTGITGAFSVYGADALSVTPAKSNLTGTLGNDVNAVTVADGLVEGGSLFVLQRKTTPVVQQVRGVAVTASATSLLRSLAVSGSVAGTAGISISGDVPVVVSDTEATIGARANVNMSSALAPGVNQSVTVAASSDLYHLGIAGSVAVGGTAGVGAGAETTVFSNTTLAGIGAGSTVNAARDVAVTAKASENFAGAAVSAAVGGTAGVAGGISGFVSTDTTKATIDSSGASVTHVSAGGNVVVDADDQTRAIVTGGTIAIGGAAAGVGIGVGLAVVIKDTEAEIGASANVTGLGNGTGNDLAEYTGADFSGSRSGRGVLVQANSGESVTGIVVAGAGGLYAGVAGAVAAEVFVDQTRALIDQGATINGSNGGANANQDVTVTARDSTVVSMTEGTVAVGLAGIGGAVDVAVITNATSAFIGDNTSINAARYVTVDALTNRQTSSTVASIAGGLAGVGAAISVLAVANGPDADQTSKTDSNGSFTDSANQKLSDNTIDSKFLSSSTNSNVRGASSQAQRYKSTLNLQPTLPTHVPPGNSATIGHATINAGSDVDVRARDIVNAAMADGAVTLGIGGGAGIGIAVVGVNNIASVTNGARITAGALDVAASSDRTLNGYGVAATAVGVAAALMNLTDTTSTTALIGSATVSTGGSTQVHASNNEQITIATATLAAGAAGGLSLVVVTPDTEARIDGSSTVTAATAVSGDVEVTSNNTVNINAGAAGVAVGGGGVGLTIVVESPTARALVGAGDTINSGKTGAGATAGDVLVGATTQESVISLGAGASLGDGIGGALSVVTRTETTNAEVGAATVTATGNVGVTATSTSADDLAIGGAAVGGGAGVGGSLGVTVLSSSVTASIDANADVTALGLGTDLTYVKDYQTGFSAYGANDTIKAATLQGVSGGADIQMPVTTSDVRQSGADLLLKKGTISATTATGRGVVVNAAKAQSIRSIAVSGGLGGLVGVGLSGNVPVISDTTTATIGAGALINQRNVGAAGSLQSVIVGATSDTYSLNIVGAIAGGGAAGIGASISTAIVSNTTNATIGQGARVSAKDNVAVTALAAEDFAMIAAAGAAGGIAGVAGGLSLISIDDHTGALIDKSAVVTANNDVVVVASDITREATFAGSIVLSGTAGIGAAVSVALISKETDATIDSNAHVSGLAQGSDQFQELTGANAVATRNGQGVLVDAESAESAYVFALGAGGAGIVAAAGAIAVEVFNTNTFATINSGAVVNGVPGGSALQDVAVTARDLTGIVTTNYGVAISGVASLAGGVDVGVLNSNVGASIGDATVNAGRDVLVNAVASKAIDSTAVSAAASAIALSAGVSVYSIGNGVDPNGKASDELKTSDSSGSVTNFAGNSLSVGGKLGSSATATTSASNSKNSGSSTATSSASSASGTLSAKLGAIDVSGKMTAQNAAVAGTSATIGNANITAAGAVTLNGADQVAYTAKTGALSAGGFGVGAGIGIFTDAATTTAKIGGTGAATISAGSVSLLANTAHTANLTSYAGSVALLGALEADVALVTDNSVTQASVVNAAITDTGGLSVEATSGRHLSATASGVAAALGAGVGVSEAKAEIGGSVTTTLQHLAVGNATNSSGFVTAEALSDDSASATASSAAGGLGGAGSGAESTATVNPNVTLTLSGDTIYSNGAVTLLSRATDSATAHSEGVAVAGGLSVGASIANASLAPQVQITITGGDIEAASLQSDAQVLSGGATAFASGASGAFIGVNATEASASDSSSARADGSGGIINTSGALNFNAKSVENNNSNATGLAIGIVAVGANISTASSNTQTKSTFTIMSKLGGGSISLDAESSDSNVATSTSGSGGVISGASSTAKTISSNLTVAQISGSLGGVRTVVDATGGSLSLVAQHSDTFEGSVDSTQAAVVGASGARLSHSVGSTVAAGFGDNVDASAGNLTIGATNTVRRFFVCETGCGIAPGAVDLMGWDVQSGSGGFVDAPAATGTTTVQVVTSANLGQNTNVHLIAPVSGTGLASVSAANDVLIHQKTKVDSGGAISIASGESNVTVLATATVAFDRSSSLVVDVGDIKAAAWSNVAVEARTSVSSYGVAGAPTGSAKANVTVSNLLSAGTNVRIEASNGVFPVDGTVPTNGTVTLNAGRDLSSQPGSLSLNTIVDLYNNTAIPIPTAPDAQSNLTSNSVISIAQSDTAPAGGPDPHYGVNAAGDINVFADQGTMSTRADGTGTNIYLKALSKIGSAISNLFGGGDVSFDIKGGSTQQNGTSTLVIDGMVDTGIRRTKSLTITYASDTCDPSSVACIVRTGDIGSTMGTYQAGGAILDRLGQIDALLTQYSSDIIATAAYQSEKTFLQAKLVALGLGTGSGASFHLNPGVTEGSPSTSATQNRAVLADALSAFQSEVTTTIGTVLNTGLTNIAFAWNGKDLNGNADPNAGAQSYDVVANAGSALSSYAGLSKYSAINGDTGAGGIAFRAKVSDVSSQIGAGNSALSSASSKLVDIKASAADISTQVAAIISNEQDVAQGNKQFSAVQSALATSFAAISTDQTTIVSKNSSFLTSVQAIGTAAANISSDLSYIQSAASGGTSGDNNTITAMTRTDPNPANTGSITRLNNSVGFINLQINGGTVSSGGATPTVITGLSSSISSYAAQVASPPSGKSISAWQTDLNTKAQASAGSGTAGAVSTTSPFVQLNDVSVQLGNVNLGGKRVMTSTGTGKIYAPGDARIDIVNETAATLKIQNLNIPTNDAGHITLNSAAVYAVADIDHITGAASGFGASNILTAAATGQPQVNITSNYNPESLTYYDPASPKNYLNKLQVAPDIILMTGKAINNLNGSVAMTSQAGNIYVQGAINAGSVSVIARNGDLVTSFVNGFDHVGGDPASQTQVPGSAVTPSDPVVTGLGIIANGQIFLAARYLNINSTVQSGIANWSLTLNPTTQLVTTDATRVGQSAADVAQKISDYRLAPDKTVIPSTFSYGNGVTLNLATGELTFSIATADADHFAGAFKFVDSGSGLSGGIYSAQVGASYDATAKQVVIDGTSVHGGYIQIFGQIINTSSTGAGNLNVLDGFGTINITNNINVPVVLSTLNTGADPTGTGRGTAGVIDITDVHIDSLNASVVDATHTVFTRDLDPVSGTRKVKVTQQQGTLDPTTGAFVLGTSPLTSTASSTGARTGTYNPMLAQRYVWTTADDYTVTDNFHVTSDNIFHSGDLAVNRQSTWEGVSASRSVPIRLLDGTYVSATTDTTTQTIDGQTQLVTGTINSSVANSTLENTLLTSNNVKYQKAPASLTETGREEHCNWYTLCIASKVTVYYELVAQYREIVTNSLKADNPINVNFIGADVGSINVTSGSNVILKGNINNVTGTTTITATNGASIIQSSANPIITSKSVNLTAGGSVGGVVNPGDTFVALPVSVVLSNINGSRGQLDAHAGNGVVSVSSPGDLIVGQVTAAGNVAAGLSSVRLSAGTNISAASGSSLIQADRISLTALTGSIGSVSGGAQLAVNTGFTTDQALRPFGDPATTSGITAYYGLSASAAGDINVRAGSWTDNADGTILANSIVSKGGDVKLTTAGQVLDGNPVQQFDKRTYQQLVDYWNALGLTAGTTNAARQAASIKAFEQSQTQAYRQYWQIRDSQPNKGAAFDPSFQVTYTRGTAQYQNLDTYYRNLEIANNGGVAPSDIEARVASDIAKQAAADTARYRALNTQVGSLTTTFNASFSYTATAAEQASLTQGAVWSKTALGFSLSAGALKTVTDTNPVIKDPNVSGRNVTILADAGIGESVVIAGNSTPGIRINPTTDPVRDLSDSQKVALATAERSDLVLTIGGVQLPANATAAQIAAYNAAVALGIANSPTDIPLGTEEAKMTAVQRAALDAAAAGIAKNAGTFLTVESKRPLNVAASQSFNATVTDQTSQTNIDQGKAFIASRGDLVLGQVAVTDETRIKAIGSLTNAANSSIQTGNLVLESATGSIGGVSPLVLNLRPAATITARALNGVNLSEVPGGVNGSEDAIVDTAYSPNLVTIRAAGSILNANNDLLVNVLGSNVVLTADTGSIGSLTSSLNVGTTPGGSISATASHGLVDLYGVAGLDFTIGSDLAGTSTRLVAAVDGTIDGPVTAGTDIAMSAGGRLVLTASANILSGAGQVQVDADTLKMLNGSRITASLGTVQINTINDALVTGILSGSGNANAISVNAGGHILAATNPARPFDLAATATGAGIRLVAGLGIGDESEADDVAVDQAGRPPGSANQITAAANPLILRTNAIDVNATRGDVNLITATAIRAGSVVTGLGSINIVANQDFSLATMSATQGNVALRGAGAVTVTNVSATSDPAGHLGRVMLTANDSLAFGSVTAAGSADLSSGGFIHGNSITSGAALSETAGAEINVLHSRAAQAQAQTPTSISFGDLTVDNAAALAAEVTEVGVLRSAAGNSPLFFTLTGYQGGQGLRAKVFVDAPNGVLMPLLRETQAEIGTNALDYGISNATIGEWLKLTTPVEVIWDDNRSPRPVRGFDVQLFQPSKSFFLYQNGFRTDTNAVVIQFSEKAEVIEERNGEVVEGASLVRDIDRLLGLNNFASVLLPNDSPDSSGPFFRGDSFARFLDSLRDRSIHVPKTGPALNLKGLAWRGGIGQGYQVVIRGATQ
ncbi:hypothetical protein HA482_25475, partial [Bradyrhizobium sp. INPA_01384B]|nr:hypothetical protein [Bradyrhizobium campsiandrae]